MADTEVLRALFTEQSDKIDHKLDDIHEKVNKSTIDMATFLGKQEILNESVTQHIRREDIHKPIPPEQKTCEKAEAVAVELTEHKNDHTEIVKKDAAGIVGKAVIALILSGSGILALIAYLFQNK